MKSMKKSKKYFMKVIIIGFVILIPIAAITLVLLYGKYIKKENNLVLFSNADHSQQIYILGTIHEYHFDSLLGYSYLDVQNVISNLKPDLLLLEVDQGVFEQYGVIKSPVEMIPLWCYALEHGIEVKGVDWFEVNEGSRSWTTDKERDDHIFENTLAAIDEESVVLVILGATHRIEQAKRFADNGFIKQRIPNKSQFFMGKVIDEFYYPENTVDELEKQIIYWNTVAKDKAIAVTKDNGKGRAYWLDHYYKLINSLLKIKNEIIIPNSLFW